MTTQSVSASGRQASGERSSQSCAADHSLWCVRPISLPPRQIKPYQRFATRRVRRPSDDLGSSIEFVGSPLTLERGIEHGRVRCVATAQGQIKHNPSGLALRAGIFSPIDFLLTLSFVRQPGVLLGVGTSHLKHTVASSPGSGL